MVQRGLSGDRANCVHKTDHRTPEQEGDQAANIPIAHCCCSTTASCPWRDWVVGSWVFCPGPPSAVGAICVLHTGWGSLITEAHKKPHCCSLCRGSARDLCPGWQAGVTGVGWRRHWGEIRGGVEEDFVL